VREARSPPTRCPPHDPQRPTALVVIDLPNLDPVSHRPSVVNPPASGTHHQQGQHRLLGH